MARPVGADAEATRARILSSAAHLFSEKGAGETSMRDIARAAKVSLATVHHYFGGKDDLYRASVEAMYFELHALRDELTRAVASAEAKGDVLDRAVRATFRFAREHRAAVQLVMRTVIDTGELPEERRSGLLLPFLDEGAALLSSVTGRPEGELRLVLQSLNHVIVRYAITSGHELGLITKKEGERAAEEAIEDHLVFVAQTLLMRPLA